MEFDLGSYEKYLPVNEGLLGIMKTRCGFLTRQGHQHYKHRQLASREHNGIEFAMSKVKDDFIYITGGGVIGNSAPNVECYDLKGNTWLTLPQLNKAR
mmetsp:Transcript_15937/g.21609  ORF Transcript_15937/g.21609 Transcript_15937/m.21609 type:complete len:98 (+) Transcript_15937:320-613(+)